jgi:hypothetical protein
MKERLGTMQQLKWMLNGALFTLLFILVLTFTILVMSEMQEVQADVVQPAVSVNEDIEYAKLTDAPPQRDITAQRFAPLEVTQ